MRWQDNGPFCDWLLCEKYAEMRGGLLHPFLTGGVVLYLHDAWVAGKAEASKRKPLICQCEACKKPIAGGSNG